MARYFVHFDPDGALHGGFSGLQFFDMFIEGELPDGLVVEFNGEMWEVAGNSLLSIPYDPHIRLHRIQEKFNKIG